MVSPEQHNIARAVQSKMRPQAREAWGPPVSNGIRLIFLPLKVLEDPYSFRAVSGHDGDIHVENSADLIHIPGYLACADQAGCISKSPSL